MDDRQFGYITKFKILLTLLILIFKKIKNWTSSQYWCNRISWIHSSVTNQQQTIIKAPWVPPGHALHFLKCNSARHQNFMPPHTTLPCCLKNQLWIQLRNKLWTDHVKNMAFWSAFLEQSSINTPSKLMIFFGILEFQWLPQHLNSKFNSFLFFQ